MTIKESDIIKDLSVDQLKQRDAALALGKGEDQKGDQLKIDFTDFIAIFIASLQTIFLPVVLLLLIFIVFALFFNLAIQLYQEFAAPSILTVFDSIPNLIVIYIFIIALLFIIIILYNYLFRSNKRNCSTEKNYP